MVKGDASFSIEKDDASPFFWFYVILQHAVSNFACPQLVDDFARLLMKLTGFMTRW